MTILSGTYPWSLSVTEWHLPVEFECDYPEWHLPVESECD